MVKAADADVLEKASEAVRDEVAKLKDVTDVQSDLAQSVPRISVKANDKAADAGFDETTLGAAVAGAVRGTPSGKAIMDDTERDVVVKSAQPGHHDGRAEGPQPLGPVKLGQIADVEARPRPGLDDPDRRPARGDDHGQADR